LNKRQNTFDEWQQQPNLKKYKGKSKRKLSETAADQRQAKIEGGAAGNTQAENKENRKPQTKWQLFSPGFDLYSYI